MSTASCSAAPSLPAPDRILAGALNDRPYLLLVGTALAWAGNAIAGQLAVGHVSPMALVFLRWVLVSIVMAALYGRQVLQYAAEIRRVMPYLMAMGAIGYTGFNSLFYVASTMTSGVNIGILQGSIPIIVLLGAFLAYRTKVVAPQIVGAAVTLTGVVIVATAGSWQRLIMLAFNPGDAVMAVACVLYAGYTVGLKRRPALPAMVFFAVLAWVALLTSLPLLAVEAGLASLRWPDAQGWLVTAYVALFPSLLAQLWFIRGVELIGPGRAGLFVNLVPVFAALLAVLLLSEAFRAYHAVALALVLGGIAIAETVNRRSG